MDARLRLRADLDVRTSWRVVAQLAVAIGLSSALTSPTPTAAAGPEACLDLLSGTEDPSFRGGLKLGRVKFDGKVMEPVLAWKTEDESASHPYAFRSCTSGLPEEIPLPDANIEFYADALVAYFNEGKTSGLATYEELPFLGFDSAGAIDLSFDGGSYMLQARRLDDQHIEVTGSESVQIGKTGRALATTDGQQIGVLIVASRNTIQNMAPNLWDGVWGSNEADARIQRAITWWEITEPGHLSVHSPVASFSSLLDLSSPKRSQPWDAVVENELVEELRDTPIGLVVLGSRADVPHAESMLEVVREKRLQSTIQVAAVAETLPKDLHDQMKSTTERLGGRYWLLVRMLDLAAIMPGNIAGKIRQRYYLDNLDRSSEASGFHKDYYTLALDSGEFDVANAIFQDQATGMSTMMSFLGCLLESEATSKSSSLEVLREGLGELAIDSSSLDAMDVRDAFRFLFQGFSLPSSSADPELARFLKVVGERNFISSISSNDREVHRLISSLRDALGEMSLDPEAGCQMTLIPDTYLLAEFEEPIQVAAFNSYAPPPTPEPVDVTPSVSAPKVDPEIDRLLAEVSKSELSAMSALQQAIEAQGGWYAKRRIKKGNELFDQGRQLLTGGATVASLQQVLDLYAEAKGKYDEGKEKAFKIQHDVPRLRLH